MDQEVTTAQSIATTLMFLYGVAVITVAIRGWWSLVDRALRGEPILPERETIPATWGLADLLGGVFLIGGLIVVCQFMALMIAGLSIPPSREAASPEQNAAAIWGYLAASLIGSGLIAIAIIARGGFPRFFGTTFDQFCDDIRIGLIAFCMISVPVIVIQATLTQFFPYEHEMINMLVEAREWTVILPILFSVAVVAPLVEEFFIRMVFQGWMDDVAFGRLKSPQEVLVGHFWPGAKQGKSGESFIDAELVSPPPELSWSALPPSQMEEESGIQPDRQGPQVHWYLPILISSLLFAVLHIGQGPAPFALFFFALGAGYVYQRLRCLTACIVIHGMLNGQTAVLLLLQMFVLPDLPT